MDKEETPSNVVPIRRGPGAAATSFRMKKNAFFDKLLGPETVNYVTGESNYDDDHEEPEESGRTANLMIGSDEGRVHHINEGREIKHRKGLQDE